MSRAQTQARLLSCGASSRPNKQLAQGCAQSHGGEQESNGPVLFVLFECRLQA